MLYNKNKVSKTNDKKILHKVGKQWKVVSVALLLAVAGGAAVATTNNAHAESFDDLNTSAVNSEAASLEAPQSANSAFTNASAQSSTVAPSASSAVNYYGGASGSAASYFARVNSDKGVASANASLVNKYVNSLNDVYTPQVNSFNAKYGSLKAEANKDSKLAQSYSAANVSSKVATTVSSLAAKNSMNPSTYKAFVEGAEQMYSGEVSGAANDVKAAKTIESLAYKLGTTNLSDANLSAKAASVEASSAAESASATVASLSSASNNSASDWVADANSLMYYGSALGNNANWMASTFSNMAANSVAAPNQASAVAFNYFKKSVMSSAMSYAVSSAVSSAETSFSNDLKDQSGHPALDNFQSGAYSLASYDNVNSVSSVSASSNNMAFGMSAGSNSDAFANFNSAVSAEVNFKMGQYVYAQATSLLGEYKASNANYVSQSKADASLSVSANGTFAAAKNKSAYAFANSVLVSDFTGAVSAAYDNGKGYALLSGSTNGVQNSKAFKNSADAEAFVAKNLLSDGVMTVASEAADVVASAAAEPGNDKYGLSLANVAFKQAGYYDPSTVADTTAKNNTNELAFGASLASATTANASEEAVLNDVFGMASASSMAKGKTLASVAANLSSAASDFASVTFTNSSDNADPASNDVKGGLTDAQKGLLTDQTVTDALKLVGRSKYRLNGSNASVNSLNAAMQKVASLVSKAASVATDANYDLVAGQHHDPEGFYFPEAASAASAALLSDGVDGDTLSDEANAFSDVASAANSAMSDSNLVSETSHMNYATMYANALSLAASSANSNLTNDQASLASYDNANDVNDTLASYFASSYTSDATSASNEASDAYSLMDAFYQNNAEDPAFDTADNAYNDALTAAANDKKLGVMNAKVVFNTSAHYLDVLKGAKLHSATNFGSKGDKVLGMVNKGERLTVLGVNFNYRGATRYYVETKSGKKGFFTAQANYSKAAYLNATSKDANVAVKLLKPVTVFSKLNGGKVVQKLPKGQVVDNATVVTAEPNGDAMGYTKVETKEGNFFTANTDYVALSAPVANNTPVAPAAQPSNTNLDPFYNDNSQL